MVPHRTKKKDVPMTFKKNTAFVSAVAVISALATVVDAGAASAQSAQGGYQDNGYPNNSYPNNTYPNNNYPNNSYPNSQYDQGYDRSQADRYTDNGYDRDRPAEPAPP